MSDQYVDKQSQGAFVPGKAKRLARAAASFLMAFSSVVLVVSGAFLYLMPHGNMAYWNSWSVAGLGKDEWEALHVAFAFLFSVAMPVHLVLNWSVLVQHVRQRARALAAAVALSLLFLGGACVGAPPVSWLMELSARAKEAWGGKQPPFPHFERRTLGEVASMWSIPVEEVLKRLREKGVEADAPSESLEAVAKRNGISPAEVFERIGLAPGAARLMPRKPK